MKLKVILMKLFQEILLSYESWTTDRQPVDTAGEFQIDNSSASNISSLSYLIAAHLKHKELILPTPPGIFQTTDSIMLFSIMLKLENIFQKKVAFVTRRILFWLIIKKTIILNNIKI